MAPLKERRRERTEQRREEERGRRKERKGGGYLGSLTLKKGSTYAVPNVRRQDHSLFQGPTETLSFGPAVSGVRRCGGRLGLKNLKIIYKNHHHADAGSGY